MQGYTVDNQVGRLVAKLKEMGVMENTVIIYTSDNGRFHGSHGLYDKAILYDEAVKEMLVVYDGRAPKERRGVRIDAMVSSTDVAPTIVSLAGVKPPEAMQGKDLSGWLKGNEDGTKWRDTVLLENFFIQAIHVANGKKDQEISERNEKLIADNRSYRTIGVRTKRYKYMRYYEHNPVIEELYDLDASPHEQKNVVADPEYADVLVDLRKRTEELHDEMKAK